jgi:hypothetical protein
MSNVFLPVPITPTGRANGTNIGAIAVRRIKVPFQPLLMHMIRRETISEPPGEESMRTVQRVTRTILAAAVCLAAGIAGAHADSFGAISLSPSTGASGWSHDFTSRWQAEDAAQTYCYRNARDCRVAIWFKNSCGAVARGPDGGWGADWAEDSRSAQRAALAACSRHSYNCRVVRWQCSGAH